MHKVVTKKQLQRMYGMKEFPKNTTKNVVSRNTFKFKSLQVYLVPMTQSKEK